MTLTYKETILGGGLERGEKGSASKYSFHQAANERTPRTADIF